MASIGLLLIRLMIGIIMIAHGAQKLFGWFNGPGLQGMSKGFESMGIRPGFAMAFLAGLCEFAGGFLLAIGLMMPLATVLVMIPMIAAIIKVHLSKGFFSSNGGVEFPLLILITALGLFFTGAGWFSVDAYLFTH